MGDVGKGDWPTLHAAARLGLIALRLPNVVLQELVDLRRRDLAQLLDLESRARDLRLRLFRTREAGAEPTNSGLARRNAVDELCADYEAGLAVWFDEAGSVLPDPAVTHHELVRRVLARRRPFNDGERGYRDALVWHSALECAASGPVILLSANTKDFAERDAGGDWQLAADLVADLEQRGWPTDRVTLVTATTALVERSLPPWNDSRVQAAWSTYASSAAFIAAVSEALDSGLGIGLTSPPHDAPRWLWHIGLRSLERVAALSELRVIEDGDGWYRIHASLEAAGSLGGLAWAWSGSSEASDSLVLWDDWGGATEYYRRSQESAVVLTVAARYRPLVELQSLDILSVSLVGTDVNDPTLNRLRRVQQDLVALLTMLDGHLDDRSFLNDVLIDRRDEYALLIGGVLSEWDTVADEVTGRYQTLAADNVAVLLEEPAGLRALRADLEAATNTLAKTITETERLRRAT